MADQTELSCFLISPIGEAGGSDRATADKVLKHLVKKALEPEYNVSRADEDSNPGAITPRIVSAILDADLIVADLSGFNPNVYYELAIAHGFRKPVVHIQKSNEKPAFDVKDMRIVRYNISDPDELELAQNTLQKYARHAVEKPETVETPLTTSVRFAELEASSDPVAESNVQIIEAINGLRYEVYRAFRSQPRRAPSPVVANLREDVKALRKIIRRVVDDGRAVVADFAETISLQSSSDHDGWVREGLRRVSGLSSEAQLNEILFDSELAFENGIFLPMAEDESYDQESGSA